MREFSPRLDVLPPSQLRLWSEFRGTLPRTFVLYGGTALALRTGSRQSEDFDFFTNDPVDAHQLSASLSFLAGARLIQAAPSTATFLVERVEPVKVSFLGGLVLGRVGEPSVATDTGVQVASLLDLAAQKVRVVQVRAERKDYLDLATLFGQGVTLARALGAAQALYPEFEPLVSLKALSYFGDGDLEALSDGVRRTLTRAVAEVGSVEVVALLSDHLV
jgi:hypothetical protein